MILWLDAVIAWSVSARAFWLADMHRQQAWDGMACVERFWSGDWLAPKPSQPPSLEARMAARQLRVVRS